MITDHIGQHLAHKDRTIGDDYQYRVLTLPATEFHLEAALAATWGMKTQHGVLQIDCWENKQEIYDYQLHAQKLKKVPKCCNLNFGNIIEAKVPVAGYGAMFVDYCKPPADARLISVPLAMAAQAPGATLLYPTFCKRTGQPGLERVCDVLGFDPGDVHDQCGFTGMSAVATAVDMYFRQLAYMHGISLQLILKANYRGAASDGENHGAPMVTLGYQIGVEPGLDITMINLD